MCSIFFFMAVEPDSEGFTHIFFCPSLALDNSRFPGNDGGVTQQWGPNDITGPLFLHSTVTKFSVTCVPMD